MTTEISGPLSTGGTGAVRSSSRLGTDPCGARSSGRPANAANRRLNVSGEPPFRGWASWQRNASAR